MRRWGRKGIVPVFIGLGEWRVLNLVGDCSYWSTGCNGLEAGTQTHPHNLALQKHGDFHRGLSLLQKAFSVPSFLYSDRQGP